MKVDKRIAVSIGVIVVLVLLMGVVTPLQIGNFFSINKKILELREKIVQLKKDVESEDKFNVDKEALMKEIFNLQGKIIAIHNIPSLQAYLSSRAKEYNVEVIEVNSAQSKGEKKVGENTYLPVSITLSLEGTYHNFGKFLADVEYGPYFLSVKSFLIQEAKPYSTVKIEFVTWTEG